MPKDLDSLKSAASAEIDGVEVPASHTPETYALINQAREELKNWLPQWGKKPEVDGRAIDDAGRLRELNDAAIKKYLPLDLPDEKHRVRNLLHIKDFCRKLHNILGFAADGGTRIFINNPPYHPAIDRNMKGLFIKMRGMDNFIFHINPETMEAELPPGWKKICSIQTPYMSEWGVMNKDERGMFKSWKYIGWRGQVLLRLILQGAITKEEAHNEFGVPQGVEVDREYLRILEAWERNGKRTN